MRLTAFFLICCLLGCLHAEDVRVHLTEATQRTEFLEAWYSVPSDAQQTDRIALYPQSVGSNISSVDPIRYVFVPSSLSASNSRATSQLWTNSYAQPLQAVYSRGASHDTAQALSISPLASTSSNLPLQGRLSIGQRSGEVRVSWQTAAAGKPLVKFGLSPGSYSQQQFGTYSTYTAADLCSQPANAWGYSTPGFINTAVLQGLQPNTTYYYMFGDESWGWSEEASFTTPPASGATSSSSPLRLLVTADMGLDTPDGAELPDDTSVGAQLKAAGHLVPPGTSEYTVLKAALLATGQLTPAPGSLATRQLMQQLLAGDKAQHGVVVLGGLSMAVGHGAMWDDFLQQLQPVFTRAPLMAAPGDTEAADPALEGAAFPSTASGGECGVAYTQRLRMPHRGTSELWYSVDMGPVHFVMLNTEQSLAADSPQYGFLQTDLSSVVRSKTPWVVVGMHRGMYVDDPTDSGPGSPSQKLQEQVERLLVEHSVDLVLNGHARLYHQSCPIVQGNCVGFSSDGSALGPVHAMLGIGGAAIPLRAKAQAPEWLVAEAFEHGVAQLVADTTSLQLQVVSARTGQEVSSFKLTKPSSWAPNPALAAQRFATLQAAASKRPGQVQPATAAKLAAVVGDVADGAGDDSTSGVAPDFDGLNQLLTEDLLAAAATSAAPSVLEKFVGPSSYLSKVVTSLLDGEAPAPATTWQTTLQLMQMALSMLTPMPGAPNPMQPGPQDPTAPPPQQPILDPPGTIVMPPITPPAIPDPPPSLNPVPPPQDPMLPVPSAPTQPTIPPPAPQSDTQLPQTPPELQPQQPTLDQPTQQPTLDQPQQRVPPLQPGVTQPGPFQPHPKTNRKPQHSWRSPQHDVPQQNKWGQRRTTTGGANNGRQQPTSRGGGGGGGGWGPADGGYYGGYGYDAYYGGAGAGGDPMFPPCDGPDCGGGCPDGSPDCGLPPEDCIDEDCGFAGRGGGSTSTRNKVSSPLTGAQRLSADKTPQLDGRFHYGEWFSREQKLQDQSRTGRPSPRTPGVAPVHAAPPRSARQIDLPQRAWGDPTVAPMGGADADAAYASPDAAQQVAGQNASAAGTQAAPMGAAQEPAAAATTAGEPQVAPTGGQMPAAAFMDSQQQGRPASIAQPGVVDDSRLLSARPNPVEAPAARSVRMMSEPEERNGHSGRHGFKPMGMHGEQPRRSQDGKTRRPPQLLQSTSQHHRRDDDEDRPSAGSRGQRQQRHAAASLLGVGFAADDSASDRSSEKKGDVYEALRRAKENLKAFDEYHAGESSMSSSALHYEDEQPAPQQKQVRTSASRSRTQPSYAQPSYAAAAAATDMMPRRASRAQRGGSDLVGIAAAADPSGAEGYVVDGGDDEVQSFAAADTQQEQEVEAVAVAPHRSARSAAQASRSNKVGAAAAAAPVSAADLDAVLVRAQQVAQKIKAVIAKYPELGSAEQQQEEEEEDGSQMLLQETGLRSRPSRSLLSADSGMVKRKHSKAAQKAFAKAAWSQSSSAPASFPAPHGGIIPPSRAHPMAAFDEEQPLSTHRRVRLSSWERDGQQEDADSGPYTSLASTMQAEQALTTALMFEAPGTLAPAPIMTRVQPSIKQVASEVQPSEPAAAQQPTLQEPVGANNTPQQVSEQHQEQPAVQDEVQQVDEADEEEQEQQQQQPQQPAQEQQPEEQQQQPSQPVSRTQPTTQQPAPQQPAQQPVEQQQPAEVPPVQQPAQQPATPAPVQQPPQQQPAQQPAMPAPVQQPPQLQQPAQQPAMPAPVQQPPQQQPAQQPAMPAPMQQPPQQQPAMPAPVQQSPQQKPAQQPAMPAPVQQPQQTPAMPAPVQEQQPAAPVQQPQQTPVVPAPVQQPVPTPMQPVQQPVQQPAVPVQTPVQQPQPQPAAPVRQPAQVQPPQPQPQLTAQQLPQPQKQQPQQTPMKPSTTPLELVFGTPVAKNGQQMLALPPNLVLLKSDGSKVSEGTLAAFKYVWQLLQGRLMFGDTSVLATFQPTWAGGWLTLPPPMH